MAKKSGHATPVPTGVSKSAAATASTGTTHDALVAIGLMVGFVFLLVMVAGIGPKSGRVAVGFMVLLFVGQAIGHVNPFVTWAENHPLTPGNSSQPFTASGF